MMTIFSTSAGLLGDAFTGLTGALPRLRAEMAMG
jgi:hypothetical protein